MKLVPLSLEGGEDFVVLADGWDGVGHQEPLRVGLLRIDSKNRTASFVPEGEWANGELVKQFSNRALEKSKEKEGLWLRWLLELGTNAMNGRVNQLSRFI